MRPASSLRLSRRMSSLPSSSRPTVAGSRLKNARGRMAAPRSVAAVISLAARDGFAVERCGILVVNRTGELREQVLRCKFIARAKEKNMIQILRALRASVVELRLAIYNHSA